MFENLTVVESPKRLTVERVEFGQVRCFTADYALSEISGSLDDIIGLTGDSAAEHCRGVIRTGVGDTLSDRLSYLPGHFLPCRRDRVAEDGTQGGLAQPSATEGDVGERIGCDLSDKRGDESGSVVAEVRSL